MSSSGERTEQATPRRIQKAQEEGDRPRSRDLLTAGATLAGVLTLGALAPRWVELWRMAYQRFLDAGVFASWDDAGSLRALLGMRQVALLASWPVGLIFAAVFTGALAAGMLQGGGLTLHPKGLQPKFNRLSPGTNLKNLFSMQAISRLGKSLLPAGVVALIAYYKLRHQELLPAMSLERLPGMFSDAYDLFEDAAWVLFVWAAIDYALEWRSWSRRLRMTKQDIRDEFKESEGNPQVRGRLRNLQRQMRNRQLKADVSRATVIITNPTHYAVALSFDFETMDTPRVLAKGRNLLAEEIKREARWAGVPIVENPPLARSLYRSVEPGQPIPLELYAAVAGILAYLYRREVEETMRRQQQQAANAAANNAAAAPDAATSRAPLPAVSELEAPQPIPSKEQS